MDETPQETTTFALFNSANFQWFNENGEWMSLAVGFVVVLLMILVAMIQSFAQKKGFPRISSNRATNTYATAYSLASVGWYAWAAIEGKTERVETTLPLIIGMALILLFGQVGQIIAPSTHHNNKLPRR